MYSKAKKIAAFLMVGGLSVVAQAEQTMDCKNNNISVTVNDAKTEVEVEVSQYFESENVFKFNNGGVSFGPHENVKVVFAKSDCTELKGNLITCAGKPLRTLVIGYWTSGPEVAIDMTRVNVQTREVQALEYKTGKPYETIQILVGGNTVGQFGGETIINVNKSCNK